MEPQKSQIIGMIAAAMGIRWEEKGRLEELEAKYDIIVLSEEGKYPRVYEDFQTVSKRKTLTGRLHDPKKLLPSENEIFMANNKSPMRTNAGYSKPPIRRKEYIEDSSFEVYVLGIEGDLKAARDALRSPYYPLYLGRKCCTPASIVCGDIEEIEEGS